MNKNYLIILLAVLTFNSARAQDSVLLSPKWQAFFSNVSNERYLRVKLEDFNPLFGYGNYHDGLVIFKDTTRISMEVKIKFLGIDDLCDPTKPLEAKDYVIAHSYSFNKRDVKYFVFGGLLFVLDPERRKPFTPSRWSVVMVDGPVLLTKQYYIQRYASGTVIGIDSEEILKYNDYLSSGLETFGGFSFKKFVINKFSDDKELVDKVTAGQEGYTKAKDALRVIKEYNEWVKNTDPATYRKNLVMHKYLKD